MSKCQNYIRPQLQASAQILVPGNDRTNKRLVTIPLAPELSTATLTSNLLTEVYRHPIIIMGLKELSALEESRGKLKGRIEGLNETSLPVGIP
ncbi:hypothetical protein G6O67_006199 [Ophiocordyceps sinensis]|uniref:Uncharacterized protein n=1 Tax=Ophiocordyceps sinensis TaxID=72228 RepID=A0A8H4PMS0_9HYPO|nr:hypothetical protein G6O67_006199 [Ophiocordyceps sinensis]